LDKNKDYAIPVHAEILKSSKKKFLSQLFKRAGAKKKPPPKSKRGRGRRGGGSAFKFQSVASQFKVGIFCL